MVGMVGVVAKEDRAYGRLMARRNRGQRAGTKQCVVIAQATQGLVAPTGSPTPHQRRLRLPRTRVCIPSVAAADQNGMRPTVIGSSTGRFDHSTRHLKAAFCSLLPCVCFWPGHLLLCFSRLLALAVHSRVSVLIVCLSMGFDCHKRTQLVVVCTHTHAHKEEPERERERERETNRQTETDRPRSLRGNRRT